MEKATGFCIVLVVVVTCLSAQYVDLDTSSLSKNDSYATNEIEEPNTVTEMIYSLEEWQKNCSLTKHYTFCMCSAYISLNPQDYTIVNGTAYVSGLNTSYHDSFYELRDGYLLICLLDSETDNSRKSDKEKISVVVLGYMTVAGLAISLLGLFVHLVAFLAIPNMKNMPGCCLACLCASMFFGYSSFLMGNVEGIRSSRVACVLNAAISHFLILSTLLWMNVKAFNIYLVLYHSTTSLRRSQTAFKCKKFSKFGLYGWGIACIFTSAALICDNIDGVPVIYRPLFAREICWFTQLNAAWIFFVGPAFIAISINIIFLGLSIRIICRERLELGDSHQSQTRSYFVTYYKMVLIMGILWLSGILASVTDNIVFWYIFLSSNVLQGFFIFLAFTYSELRKYIAEKFKTEKKSPSNAISNTTIATDV